MFQSMAQLMAQDIRDSNLTKLTYKRLARNWYVVSGLRGNEIVYHKTLLKDDFIYELWIEYPQSKTALMKPVVARVESSLTAPKSP